MGVGGLQTLLCFSISYSTVTTLPIGPMTLPLTSCQMSFTLG